MAEYEYEAQEDDELSFKPGDVITNIVKQDGGWWEGDFNGQRGMFPDNFVKVVCIFVTPHIEIIPNLVYVQRL